MQDEAYNNTMLYAAQARLDAAIETQEFNLVATLGLVPRLDGNKWCVLWGENLAEGIAGFGDTPRQAVIDFNKRVNAKADP